ncbi:LacI family DNA-binding transcriptional regulator [Streptomyces sp.]|uniref:LacI family DNA-binding transcriptional regulator n=1 Tax=Streptomyces sp. TaxID=1931 RepID=UPI002F41D932
MTDVARRAGVSQSTVSYVLNGTRPISAEVTARVEAAMRELEYTPRAAARALRGGQTRTLALSIPATEGITDPWLGLYLLRLTLAAARRGYDLLMCTDAGDAAGALRELATGRRADGAILMSVTGRDQRPAVARALGFPTVALGRPVGTDLPFVDFDFERAAELAFAEFAALGHRQVVHVGPRQAERDAGYLYVRRIIRGVTEAAEASGVGVLDFVPTSDRDDDERRFGALLGDNPLCGALLLAPSFTSFERFRSLFARLRPGSDPAQDLIIFGASGLPGAEESAAKRIVNPVDTLAAASVDCVLEILEGRAPVSRLVPPQFIGASSDL